MPEGRVETMCRSLSYRLVVVFVVGILIAPTAFGQSSASDSLRAALAEGVEEARAPWIARMDDDDISKPDRLERQVKYVSDAPEVDILGGWALECDQDGNVRRTRKFPTDHKDIIRLIWTFPLHHTTVLVRR